MKIEIIDQISISVQIAVPEMEGKTTWISESWLDGDKLKPGLMGAMRSKIAETQYWSEPRNRMNRVSRGAGHHL